MKYILAFETSCDDTAIAIIDENARVLSDVIYSQVEEFVPYGGVVPEMGSRAHIEQIVPLTKRAFNDAGLRMDEISAVAATFAPGLLGPLLVGAQFAKGFACARNIPLLAIHHLEGHVLAGFGTDGFPEQPPFIALIASGGHSALYRCNENYSIKLLGQSLDDAAGEAFDKIGRALGLGYPAGAKIDELAALGDAKRFRFSIAMEREAHYNFSFSGLKTKALLYLPEVRTVEDQRDFCASVQEAIAQALVQRAIRACKEEGILSLVLGGGVAANSRLRALISEQCHAHKLALYVPEKRHCTDNAVMIAKAALIRMRKGHKSDLSTDVLATLCIEKKGLLHAA